MDLFLRNKSLNYPKTEIVILFSDYQPKYQEAAFKNGPKYSSRRIQQPTMILISRLMVIEGDRLVGIIALKDMLNFLSFKAELK